MTSTIEDQVNDFIAMNSSGAVLELCRKYYAGDVLMLSNGSVFASSMAEAYDKQKGHVESIREFDVELLSAEVSADTAELVFRYRLERFDGREMLFTGRHIQHWQNGKIVEEQYEDVTTD